MRIALLFDPWMLGFRGSLDLDGYRQDPRGMSGSEQCAVRLFEELWNGGLAGGHNVLLYTKADEARPPSQQWAHIRPWEDRGKYEWDVAISINCPDPLRDVKAKFKVCYALLNDFSFCKVGFEQHVDLFASPSQAHLDQVMNNPEWHRVEVTQQSPNGKAQYEPDPSKWEVVPLGCDPERYQPERQTESGQGYDYESVKVPGRVVYCSSPDRGLHLLLQEWGAIKRAVPHAHLRIFYRLQPWIDSMKQQHDPETGQVYRSVYPLVRRALYIEEALQRMSDPKWGIEVCDSVSRERIEREMAEAEVLAYPLDPVNSFTEGFSCSTLEGCAARACPVISDADAFGTLYAGAAAVVSRGNWAEWRNTVIKALTDKAWREEVNDKAEALARSMTWQKTATKLMAAIEARMATR